MDVEQIYATSTAPQRLEDPGWLHSSKEILKMARREAELFENAGLCLLIKKNKS